MSQLTLVPFALQSHSSNSSEFHQQFLDSQINENELAIRNKTNRVTLKIDVSHTDHSHVIGKGGRSIKAVMTDTQCHIHFPDSNRTNLMEKSNQVSISGQPEGVERARRRIREMLPIIFCFDLPSIPAGLLNVSANPILQQIQRRFEVQICYKPTKLLCGTSVSVKGTVERAKQTKEATLSVLIHHCGQFATNIPVTLTLEIDPKHHAFVLNQSNQLNRILQATRTTITFPDNSAPVAMQIMTPPKKSTFFITGTVDNVFSVRQYLINCLPVTLMFDVVPEEFTKLEMVNICALNEQHEVSISIKPKTKQQTKSVTIKSTESNVLAVYKTRQSLLNLSRIDDYIQGPIRHTTLSDNVFPQLLQPPRLTVPTLTNFLVPSSTTTVTNPLVMSTHHPSATVSTAPLSTSTSTMAGQHHFTQALFARTSMPATIQAMKQDSALTMRGPQPPSSDSTQNIFPFLSQSAQLLITSPWGSYPHGESAPVSSQSAGSYTDPYCPLTGSMFPLNRSTVGSTYGSTMDIAAAAYSSGNGSMTSRSPLVSSTNQALKDLGSMVNISGNASTSSGVESDPEVSLVKGPCDRRAPGAEYSAKQRQLRQRGCGGGPEGTTNSGSGTLTDQSLWTRKLPANKAEGNQKSGDATFISKLEIFSDNIRPSSAPVGAVWRENSSSFTSSISPLKEVLGLKEFLVELGLGKYADIFEKQEIDMQTFFTLSEAELRELGINTFGARRKMLLAIHELQQRSL